MLIKASGTSMFPTIIDGDTYELIEVDPALLDVGEIVVYKQGDIYICHRIMKKICFFNGKVYFKTKGDNCVECDKIAVDAHNVIGKIDLKYRN